MKIAWVGQPQQEDAKHTVEAWAKNAPADITLHQGIDPSCDLLVFLEPASMTVTDTQLVMRQRFGKKTVLVIHDYLAFAHPWLAKRAVQLCNSVRLLIFWSRAHEQAFRIIHPGIRTEGCWVPILAKSESDEQQTSDQPAYENALEESSQKFWQIIRRAKC